MQICGSRRSLAPIDFHDGRDLLSFLRFINSWSSVSVQGRIVEGGMPRSDSEGWRIRIVGFGGGPFGMAIGAEDPGFGEVGQSAGKLVIGPASTADVVWTEWTLEATSSS